MTVLNARILLDFAVELFHDFVVHVLDLLLQLEDLVLDRGEVAFEFSKLKFVDVLYFFHFVCGLKVLDKLGLLFFNCGFFFLELLDETGFFLFVQNDITYKFIDLISGFDNKIFEINRAFFVFLNFFLCFSYLGEFGFFFELFCLKFFLKFPDFLSLESFELNFVCVNLIFDYFAISLVFVFQMAVLRIKLRKFKFF
jgi:hypothetical protein